MPNVDGVVAGFPRGRRRWSFTATLLCLALVGCGEPPETTALTEVVRGAQAAELNLDAGVDLGRYYAGALLKDKAAARDQEVAAVTAEKAGRRVGGVSALNLTDVRVTGSTATAKARVTIWFKTAQFSWQDPQAMGAATNVLDLSLHFTRQAGAWKIDEETSRFAPGGGP